MKFDKAPAAVFWTVIVVVLLGFLVYVVSNPDVLFDSFSRIESSFGFDFGGGTKLEGSAPAVSQNGAARVEIVSALPGSPSVITIQNPPASAEFVNLTGWKVRGQSGEVVITQAADLASGSITVPLKDVIMAPGEKVNLYSNQSPVGYSYKANACTFHFDGGDFPGYTQCVLERLGTPGFSSREWNVYLGNSTFSEVNILILEGGTLELLNEAGEVVHAYTY